MVIYVRSDTNPGEYYLFNADSGKADFLLANYSWLDPREMRTKQSVVIKTRDNQEVPAYLTLPERSGDSLPPLVVLPHGGPHYTRDYPDFDTEVQLLANRGYAVLQVNFRGGGGYGERFRAQGYQNWGGVMIDDILDGTKQVIQNKKVDGDRVCIYGASYGGYAAMMAAIKEPDLFQCAIGYVGVYDLTAKYELGDIPERYGGVGYLERVIGTEMEHLKLQSPVFNADKIKANVMLIHGEEDRRVPIYHGKEMRKALKQAGNEPEWVFLATAGHGAWSLENRTRVYTEILQFLGENIGEK
jgi:dipeptidyl aminopeptidase/acylaminoacyl peptidase